MVVQENEPMSAHTSFKVGGPARFFVKAECMDDLKNALSLARKRLFLILSWETEQTFWFQIGVTKAWSSPWPENFRKSWTWGTASSKSERELP